MDYIAILCSKNDTFTNIVFNNEEEFLKTMKDDKFFWGYLFHIKTGILISSYHPSKN
jgi:hypothetical protein